VPCCQPIPGIWSGQRAWTGQYSWGSAALVMISFRPTVRGLLKDHVVAVVMSQRHADSGAVVHHATGLNCARLGVRALARRADSWREDKLGERGAHATLLRAAANAGTLAKSLTPSRRTGSGLAA
jgi:hypothetical protein